ncbi:hypothetical protein EV2_012323 [Malus domestica]
MQQEALDQPRRRSSSPTPILRWSPPGIGGFKLNVDGALDMRSGCRGVGTVVRDGYGNMVCFFVRNECGLGVCSGCWLVAVNIRVGLFQCCSDGDGGDVCFAAEGDFVDVVSCFLRSHQVVVKRDGASSGFL